MKNSRERIFLKTIKRLFCLFAAAAMIATLLPAISFADSKEIVNKRQNRLTLEIDGSPNANLRVASGYKIEVVSSGSSLFLQIDYPDSLNRNPDTQFISSPLMDSKRFVQWDNVTIRLESDEDAWATGQDITFDVADDDSGTTISSSNVKLINFTKRKVEQGDTIKPTFEIIDYNIDESQVADTMKPYLTGYSSNASFALLDTSDIVVTRVNDSPSGKMTFRVYMELRYTGTGNSVSFTMAYTTTSGALRTVDCSVSIPNTVEGKDDDDDDEKQSDDPVPYIIVDSYDYGGTSVTAGEDFSLTLRLRNTSTTNSLENIVMSVSPMGVFSMTSSSNTFYITRLQAGSMMEKTITLKAGLTKVTDDDDANSIDMKFTYQYGTVKDDVITLTTGNSSESITLPVDFPDRFELGIPEYESQVYAGDELYLSLPMVNKGRSSVYNLTASLRGGMSNPGQSQFIGNLAAGTESSADFNIKFDGPGSYTGEVVVTYEDTNMNPKELTTVFSVEVVPMDMPDDPGMGEFPEEPTEPVDAEPKSDPTKPIKIALAALVCAMSAYVTIQKAKAKRSIYLDEDI